MHISKNPHSGGQRCESVNQAINERMEKGAFLINYTGHGGELGWAHERILGLKTSVVGPIKINFHCL